MKKLIELEFYVGGCLITQTPLEDFLPVPDDMLELNGKIYNVLCPPQWDADSSRWLVDIKLRSTMIG